jgi:hypothetical protein
MTTLNQHRSRLGRVVLCVEELEGRRVPATLAPLTVGPVAVLAQVNTPVLVGPFISSPAANLAAAVGALPAQPGNGLGANGTPTIGTFVLPGQGSVSLQVPAAATQAAALQSGGQTTATPAVTTPDTASQLPPILQAASLLQPTGPLTFADQQRITTDFIGGGHSETSLLTRAGWGNSARPSPSAAAPPAPTAEVTPEEV